MDLTCQPGFTASVPLSRCSQSLAKCKRSQSIPSRQKSCKRRPRVRISCTQDTPKPENEQELDVLPQDKPREECGVFGIWGCETAAACAYYGLHALQHRGQEGAGIVVVNSDSEYSERGERLTERKGLGLVGDVFRKAGLEQLQGRAAIGHVRYSTAGGGDIRNVQPFRAGFKEGEVAIAHNGNLTNARGLRTELEMRGSIFATTSDTEVVLHLMATCVNSGGGLEQRVADALARVQGAYSVLFLTPEKLIAVRDPHGFRPLIMGVIEKEGQVSVVFASESCALDIIDAKLIREVEPGEMVIVDKLGVPHTSFPFVSKRRRACVFEHIYFSKPSSVVFGRSVYMSRFKFGELLAGADPVPFADMVVPVPESGVPAALGYSHASGVPYQQAILRSSYVGRTFIQPSQKIRNLGVKLKLSPVKSLIENKVLIVVDDSIVRGTTSKKIVHMLRDAGAREVHMRIACPPITGSCYYGVDTPNRDDLISFKLSHEQIVDYIEADSVAFLPLESMRQFLGDEAGTFCDACFSGNYPVIPEGVPWLAEKAKDAGDGKVPQINANMVTQ